MTLKANPYSDDKAKLSEVDFKFINDTNTEIRSMRDGEVDAISPGLDQRLAQLLNVPGIKYEQVPGYWFEHLEFREGDAKGAPTVTKGSSNVLLRAPWMREAIALAIDRQSIIRTVFSPLAGGMKPLDNALYFTTSGSHWSSGRCRRM